MNEPEPQNEGGNAKKIGRTDPNAPAAIGEALRVAGIDPSDPRFTRALEISLKHFSGSLPLPPAEYVEPWEKIIPGIGRQIVTWTQTQGNHRRQLEMLRAERSERRLDRGQLIAAAVAIVGLCLATLAAINGATAAAIAIALFRSAGQLRASPLRLVGVTKNSQTSVCGLAGPAYDCSCPRI